MAIFSLLQFIFSLFILFLRQSRQIATDVNSEPSQNEQIIWDDPTAREERAKLASNLQWPSSPSQCSEQIHMVAANVADPSLRKSLTDTEIAEMGKKKQAT